MLTMGGRQGMGWLAKLEYKMKVRYDIKAQKPDWKDCAGSLMAEIMQNQQCEHQLATKKGSNTGYCQPRYQPIPETAI